MLDDVAAQLPQEIFRELNGGVSLVPDRKRSDADPNGGLYTLGTYHRDQMGRYIIIYYGSFCAVYPHVTKEKMREHLKDVLVHELTHHMESLAGTRDLEVKDKNFLDDYFSKKKR